MNTQYDAGEAAEVRREPAGGLTICDSSITSEVTDHIAYRQPSGGWLVTWWPYRLFTRDEAVTAMTLADRLCRSSDTTSGALIGAWSAELGMSPVDVLVAVGRQVEEDPTPSEYGHRGDAAKTTGGRTVVEVSPRVRVVVTEDIGHTGHAGLTVELSSGEHITVALPASAVTALVAALGGTRSEQPEVTR